MNFIPGQDSRPWVGFDFDGTLAEYHGWSGPLEFGKPVGPMVNLVRTMLANGQRVKVFTARACQMQPDRNAVIAAIQTWCLEYIGKELEVTAEKDWLMTELYDDRAYTVLCNQGILLSSPQITEL